MPSTAYMTIVTVNAQLQASAIGFVEVEELCKEGNM